MADLTVTATSVIKGSNVTNIQTKTAGEAIDAGEVVYLDTTTSTMKLADADSGTTLDAVRTPIGIALNSAGTGQPLTYMTSGDVTLGAILTAGTAYYLSGTAGKICPLADVAAGDDVVALGLAKSTSVLALNIQAPGVEL